MSEKKTEFEVSFTFNCPFCDKRVLAGRGVSGELKDAMVVTHDMPICSRFEALTPDVFLKTARLEMIRRAAQN